VSDNTTFKPRQEIVTLRPLGGIDIWVAGAYYAIIYEDPFFVARLKPRIDLGS